MNLCLVSSAIFSVTTKYYFTFLPASVCVEAVDEIQNKTKCSVSQTTFLSLLERHLFHVVINLGTYTELMNA